MWICVGWLIPDSRSDRDDGQYGGITSEFTACIFYVSFPTPSIVGTVVDSFSSSIDAKPLNLRSISRMAASDPRSDRSS